MRKCNKCLLLLLIFCFGLQSFSAHSQEEGQNQTSISTDVVPPSPSVAALGKFVDVPVGYYTGVPNISIPFGELKGREISVPISISYHASGVRVSDIPGWVGSGWALNAGGVISRTMVGLPDEKGGVGYFDIVDEMPAADDPYFYTWVPGTDTERRQVAEGQWDLQPDMFTFNFNGQSGKFAFSVEADGSIKAETIPYRNIKIEPDWSNKRWVITTEDGTKYIFGTTLNGDRDAYETSYGDGPGSHPFVSAWHLLEIITLNDTDRMDLYYAPISEQYDELYSETRYEAMNPIDAPPLGPDFSSSTQMVNPTHKIDKITSVNGSVVFGRTVGRADMNNNSGCTLSSIEFRDENEAIYRKFELNYGYMSTGSSYIGKRLRLDNIVEKNASGESKPPHIFSYNEETSLPVRDSKSVDHWGYYNGETNSTLVPRMETQLKVLPGSNRETNHAFVKSGVLEKITYPTGGEVSFEYEGHDYGSTYQGMESDPVYESVTESFSLDMRSAVELGDEATYELEIPFTQYADLSYSIVSNLPQESNAFVDIKDPEGLLLSGSSESMEVSGIQMGAGTHSIYLFALRGEWAKVSITYRKIKEDIVNGFAHAGGLRIKKITTYDGVDHSKDMVREFEYISRGETECSSGKLLVKNRYDYIHKVPILENNGQAIPVITGFRTYLVRTSANMNQNSSSSHICYSTVRELKGENGEGGYTDYYYDYYGDVACRIFPFPRPQSRDWKRGNLVKSITYDSQGIRVQMEENTYEFKDRNGEPFFKLLPAFKGAYKYKTPYDAATEYCWEPYVIECAWKYLKQKKTSHYLDGETIVNVLDYTYNQTHSQLAEVSSTGSDNKSNISRFYYPQDVSTELSPTVKTDMLDKHLISPQVKAEIFKKDSPSGIESQTGGTITKYDLAGPSNNLLLPTQQKNYEGTIYQTKLTIDEYDAYGKLLQYHKENDNNGAYYWSYENSKPVIKAENVTYSVLAAAVTSSLPSGFSTLENLLTSVNGIGDMTTQTHKNLWLEFNTNLRNQVSLNNVLLSTYTYDLTRGVTSQTDPNGMTTYYEYDAFGRLLKVRDKDNKILKENFYHYTSDENYSGKLQSYSISVTQPQNGQITPDSFKLEPGQTQEVQFIPNANYQVKDVLLNNVSQGVQSSVTLTGDQDYTVSAEMELVSYQITSSSGSGGSISSDNTVTHGTNAVVTITPNTGYHLVNVNANRSYTVSGNTYTFSNVTSSVTVSATFAINQYNVTTSAGSGGSISASSQVSHGSTKSVTITPNTGYHLVNVNANRSYTVSGNTYTFSNVTSGVTVSATFAINQYNVTTSAGSGGSISASGQVSHGSTKSVTITPNTGYHLVNVNANRSYTVSGNTYTFSNVTSGVTVSATFAINQYNVTTSAGSGGSISASSQVSHGSTKSVTITPNTGYHLVNVNANRSYTVSGNTYTFSNVTLSVTVSATFAINQYNVSTSSSSGGTISASSVVNYGSNKSVTITPNTGYDLVSVNANKTYSVSGNTYTFSNITNDVTVSATFAIKQFDVSTSAGSGGSISASSVVNYGSNKSVTITPNTGYDLVSVNANRTYSVSGNTYTFSNITNDVTVSATFAIKQFDVSTSAGSGGSISASSVVNYGSNKSVTITPNTGYDLVSVNANRTYSVSGNTYTFSNITNDVTVSATFAIKQFDVSTSAGSGGSISASSVVNYGSNKSVTITPNTGYDLVSVNANKTYSVSGNTYTFSNITNDVTVSATFAIKQFDVSTSAGSGGSISASSVVNYGSNKSVTITPNTGYHLVSVNANRTYTVSGNTYTFSNVTSHVNISATFAINTYSLSSSSGSNGSITASATVNHGSSKTFYMTPSAGYHVKRVLVDGSSVGAPTSYTFSNVTSAHSISVEYEINSYKITAQSFSGGSISPSGSVYVNHGSSKTFTFSANYNWEVLSVEVDGVNKGKIYRYTFSNVTGIHNITVRFKEKSGGGGGNPPML